MDDPSEPAGPASRDGGPSSPDRAFRLLADGTRLAILRALWAADDGPVPFSRLRERIGNPDSGRFNYHVDELEGHFASKGPGGYELTQAGREIVRAVLAGTVTDRPTLPPEEVDGRCVDCGGELVVRYDGHAAIECSACGATLMWNEFPPAGVSGRTPEEVATAFERWTRSRFRLAMEGVCPSCAGETSAELVGPDDDLGAAGLHRCGNCKYEARVPLFAHAIEHPAVVAHYHERGLDVTELPYRELLALGQAFEVDVSEGDPLCATVEIPDEDGGLRLSVDGDLQVTVEPTDG